MGCIEGRTKTSIHLDTSHPFLYMVRFYDESDPLSRRKYMITFVLLHWDTLKWAHFQGCLQRGKEGQLPPLSSSMRSRGKEFPSVLNSFHPPYLVKGHFPAS